MQYVVVNSSLSSSNKRLKLKLAAAMHHPNDGENSEETGEVCLVGQDLSELCLVEYGSGIRKIDLSFNVLVSLRGLHTCADTLEELILDNNLLEKVDFRADFPRLHTLSLNKNKITDLDTLIQELSTRVCNLRHLSLHGNPICPDQLSNNLVEEKDYQLYRYHILYHLRNIRFLEHRPVTLSELKESRRWIYAKIKINPTYTPLPPSNIYYNEYSSPSSSLPFSSIPEQSVIRSSNNNNQNTTSNILHESNMEARLSSMAISNNNYQQQFPQSDSQNMSPNSQQSTRRSRGRTGRRRFRYVGKNSEGNRFIQDDDL